MAAGAGRWDLLDLVWSEWCKTLQDFFRQHRRELKKRREAWDKIERQTSAPIRAEQERDRRTGLLFRLAKPRSEAVSDESVWLKVEGNDAFLGGLWLTRYGQSHRSA